MSVSNSYPAPLFSGNLQHVARLRFEVLDQPEKFMKLEVDDRPNLDVLELEHEIIALREQLSLQTEQTSSQVEQTPISNMTAARLNWEKELEVKIGEERETILKTVSKFRTERDRYFGEVEAEVVKLALAIAARILHREARIDPLLLSGVVRVALEKIADDSAITLRVPVDDLGTC